MALAHTHTHTLAHGHLHTFTHTHAHTLQLLNEEIEERRGQFDSVSGSCDKHLFGEEENVQQLREKFSRAAADWKSLSEGVRALPEAMRPWKSLTDQFDELSDWFEERESRVNRDLEAVGRQEEEGRDLSDYVVSLKVGDP